jgi:hypothetical protein
MSHMRHSVKCPVRKATPLLQRENSCMNCVADICGAKVYRNSVLVCER